MRMIDLEPNFFSGHVWAGIAYGFLGRYEESLHHAELQYQLNPGCFTLSILGYCNGMAGKEDKVREVIDQLMVQVGDGFYGYTWLGELYAFIGQMDEALKYFYKAVEKRESQLFFERYKFQNEPRVLNDPRMVDLYNKIGIPYK
jgi:tetratricopeptide (TPR) repeat protein